MNRKERSVCVVLSLTGRNALLCLPHSDVLISVQMDRPVHQNSSDKPTNLLHVRQLCPLKRESEGDACERASDRPCLCRDRSTPHCRVSPCLDQILLLHKSSPGEPPQHSQTFIQVTLIGLPFNSKQISVTWPRAWAPQCSTCWTWGSISPPWTAGLPRSRP